MSLLYTIRKFLNGGGFGIVEKVEKMPEWFKDREGREDQRFIKDYNGEAPQLITFRNPDGELEKGASKITYKLKGNIAVPAYISYEKGDQYP